MQRSRLSLLFFTITLLTFFLLFNAHGQSPSKVITDEEKIREEMVQISRELGVTCTECHNVQNFADNTKKKFQISAHHLKLTKMLRDNGFDGKNGPAATCYMCHRGKLIPDYKEPLQKKK